MEKLINSLNNVKKYNISFPWVKPSNIIFQNCKTQIGPETVEVVDGSLCLLIIWGIPGGNLCFSELDWLIGMFSLVEFEEGEVIDVKIRLFPELHVLFNCFCLSFGLLDIDSKFVSYGIDIELLSYFFGLD